MDSDSVLQQSTKVSKIQSSESSVQGPASNSCVQIPGIPVWRLVALLKENIQVIKSGKPRVIYSKIKVEIDTLGTPKATKQIREKVRN